MKNTSGNILEEIKTKILYSKPFHDYRAFYGIMWESLLGPVKPKKIA